MFRQHWWCVALVAALGCLLMACEDSSSGPAPGSGASGGTNNGTAGGGGDATFEPPDDLPRLCAGMSDGDVVGEAPAFEDIECESLDPGNVCQVDGVKVRTRQVCFFIGEEGGPGCGDLGQGCIVRDLVDEQGCALTPPEGPIAEGPLSDCGPASEDADPCSTEGVMSRTTQVCQGGELTNEVERLPCERVTEGMIVEAGEFGGDCAFPEDRCAEEGTLSRSVQICRGGAAATETETRPCTRDTDGDRVDLEVGDCLPIDDCGPQGAMDVTFAICVEGQDTTVDEAVDCDLAVPTSDLAVTDGNLASSTTVAAVGTDEQPASLTFGAGLTEAVDLCRIARVTGDLTIGATGADVTLAGLTEVEGDLIVTGGGQVDLPALARVGGRLVLEGVDANSVLLPALQEVGGNVELVQLTSAEAELPRLATIGGDLTVTDNAGLIQFRLPQLTDIAGSLTVTDNADLQIFQLTSLGRVGGDFTVTGVDANFATCDIYSFVAVISTRGGVGGSVSVSGGPDPDFDSRLSTSDTDGDSIVEACDNCPGTFNPEQTDSNNNGTGDDCE